MKKLVFSFLCITAFYFNQITAQTWLPALGQGIDDAALAFAEAIIEFEGDIIVTGEFSSVSGVPATYIARWNGSTWQAMGSGLPAVGRCLAIYNGELYAGLDAIGSSTLQKWNGTSWVASGPFDSPIATLYVDPVTNDFYAGGYFTSPGKFVAKLNGTTWTGIGNLPNGTSSFPGVKAINVYNGTLYVGGTFGGGTSTQYVAKLSGSSFVGLHIDQPNQPVASFVQQDGLLYMGGAFSRIGPAGSPSTRCVARWNGTNWIQMAADESGPNTALGGVKNIVSYKGQIYAVGTYTNISITGLEVNNIARWNDCSWKNVTNGVSAIGVNGTANCLAVIGDNLYIGGEFTLAGGVAGTKRIAGWNNVTECPDPICFPLEPSITIATSQLVTCAGSTVSFTSSAVNEGSAPSYQWKVDGVNAGTNSPTFNHTSASNGQVITCDITSSDPCMLDPTTTSNPITISVVAEIVPTISITAPQTNICSGTTASFSASITGGGSSPVYQWKVDGVNVGTNSSSYAAAMNDGDVVTCQLTSSESCANPTSLLSNSVTMTVTQTPSDQVTANATTLTATQTGASYQWLNCQTGNTPVSGATSQSYTPGSPGSYAVQVTIGNCQVTSACMGVGGVGIDEQATPNEFTVYPNPSDGLFHIQNTDDQSFQVSVSDLFGKKILNYEANSETIIDLNQQASGMYMLIISYGKESRHYKLMKK